MTADRHEATVTLRPIDCSGACHVPAEGCTCSGAWRSVVVVVDETGRIISAPGLPSSRAVQAAVDSLSRDANSLSLNDEDA